MFSAFPFCLLYHMVLGVCFSSVCLKCVWGKPTGFSRAFFPSTLSTFADLLGTFPAAEGGLGLWFCGFCWLSVASSPFTSSSCTSVVRSTHEFSGLPYTSDKQCLLLVSACGASLFLCPDHQQLPARAWYWVGIQWPGRQAARIAAGNPVWAQRAFAWPQM